MIQSTLGPNYFILIFPFLIILISSACKEDFRNCEGENVQPLDTYFEDDLEEASCRLQNINNNEKETHLVIRSQDDYNRYVNCTDDFPAIDFDKYFVLTGVYRHHQCALFNWQSVVLCENEIIYKVRLLEQDCQILTSISYFIVISKEFEENKIEFDVKFSN